MLLALLALAAGCASPKTARTKPRYLEAQNSFTDLAARDQYVERRTKELAQMGLASNEAAARASREWFARAPVASEVPTAYELQRREAQADLNGYLDSRKDAGTR